MIGFSMFDSILFFIFCAQFAEIMSGNAADDRIINGKPIDISEVPYQAQIIYSKFGCGGSIISDIYVLTAAHCVDSLWGEPEVRIGSSKKFQKNDRGELIKVRIKFFHPLYSGITNGYDIAILELERPIKFSNSSKPIVLADEEPSAGDVLQVQGWGETKIYGGTSDILLAVNQTVIDLVECKKLFPKVILIPEKFCAAGKGLTCRGDSGGAATLNGIQVGVVVEGNDNCDAPVVYVNVGHPTIRNFIRNVAGI